MVLGEMGELQGRWSPKNPKGPQSTMHPCFPVPCVSSPESGLVLGLACNLRKWHLCKFWGYCTRGFYPCLLKCSLWRSQAQCKKSDPLRKHKSVTQRDHMQGQSERGRVSVSPSQPPALQLIPAETPVELQITSGPDAMWLQSQERPQVRTGHVSSVNHRTNQR